MADRIALRAGKGKLRNGMIAGVFCAGVGLWASLLADQDLPYREVTALGLVLVGLGFAGWTLFNSLKGAPILVASSGGLWFKDWGQSVVPWPHVHRIYARGGRLRRFLCIELGNSDAFFATLPEKERRAFTQSPFVKPPVLLIPYGAVQGDPRDLADLLEDYRRAAR